MVYCYENAKKYLKNGGLQQIAGRQDMDNDKNRKAISENESIQEGLESFLDQELGNMKPSSASMGKSVSKPVASASKSKTPVLKPVTAAPKPKVSAPKPELKSILEEDVWEEEESFDSDYYEDDDDDYVIRRRRVYDEDLESLINEYERRSTAIWHLEALQVSTGFPLTPTVTLTLVYTPAWSP